MHITIVAAGTRGDVQPLIALARGLHCAGHTVRVATTSEFSMMVKEQELDYFALTGSPSQMMKEADLLAALGGNRNPFALVRGIVDAIRPQFVKGMTEVWDACQGAEAILVSMLGFFGAQSVAEKLHVPLVEAYVLPARPTRAFSSPLLPVSLRLGGSINWLSHRLLLEIAWLLIQPMINDARRLALGMPPLSLRRVFRGFDEAHQPILYGYSPLVLPKPYDWPEWHHVTGYWFLDRPSDWQPPEALVDFLEAGPAPVYVGFGSMTGKDPEKLTRIIIEALRCAGQRGVLLTGWGAMQSADLPDTILQIESAPHDWLFPRMEAVVHHGGSGTTAAGLRAGVPSIIVPFAGDQFFWGERISELGGGLRPIPVKRLTAERLAEAIQLATTSPAIRDCAADLGHKVRTEDGVSRAVAIFNQTLVH